MSLKDKILMTITSVVVLGFFGAIAWQVERVREAAITYQTAYETANAVQEAQKETIAVQNETIAAWKDRYEKLRWEMRTKHPQERREYHGK